VPVPPNDLYGGRIHHQIIPVPENSGFLEVLCDQPEVGVFFGKQPGKGSVSTRRGMAI
jgi:hypothetical protein